MNDRIFEINNTLLELATRTKNQGVLTSDQIYNFFAYDKTENIQYFDDNNGCSLWDKLMNKLSNHKETTTFHTYMQGWLIMRSKEFSSSIRSFKLYVNLPEEEREKYTLKIFKFLDKKKIKHVSKISKDVRADGIVIRLSDINDTRKVIDYINKTCIKFARKTNPFMHRIGCVGIGCDLESSYSMFISFVISCYLKERVDTNSLDKVSYGDFNSFSEEMYKKYFINKTGLDELTNSSYFQDEYRRVHKEDMKYTEDSLLLNIQSMFKVFLSSLNNTENINDILGRIVDVQTEYSSFESKKQTIPPFNDSAKIVVSSQSNNEQLQKLLDEYIKYAIGKYGFEQAKKQVIAFIRDNNSDECYSFITGDNNFRQKFKDSDMRNNINKIIFSIDEYFEIFNKPDYSELTKLLDSYIILVGKEVALSSLEKLDKTKDYECIEESFKDKFINCKMAEYLKYLTENDTRLYIENLYNNLNNNKHLNN